MAVFVGAGADVNASASDENINVIVPVTVGITFNEDGSTTSTTFNVFNRSSVPIEITSVSATELNNWELVSSNTVIGKDTKQLSYILEGKEILAGRNEISIPVSAMGLHNFDVNIKRGVWTYSFSYEEAFQLEFEYEVPAEKQTLTLDGNDYADDSELHVAGGKTVNLPSLQNDKYEFMGWADAQGKRYTDSFTMPESDTTLTAMWKLPTYALFSESDGSLTFVQSVEEIHAGQMHNGKEITSVYTGFDEQGYTSYDDVPWNKDGICQDILSVVFENYVFPEYTSYWFYGLQYCSLFDVTNLYTFRVRDMSYMFSRTGYFAKGDFYIYGMEQWDTSMVMDMGHMFEYSGEKVETYHIGNIGLWDVSNVWNMDNMFSSTGGQATELYIGDLSTWDTSSLESMAYMFCDMGWMAPHVDVGDIGTWDVSHVEAMTCVFTNMGTLSETVNIGDLSQWDVSNVWDFTGMFQYIANCATDFSVGDLSGWDVSNAGMMNYMFNGAGQYSKTFYLGDLSKWNTESVSEMNYMFYMAGETATWHLDLSGWNVSNVCLYDYFNTGIEDRVTTPNWVY